MITWKLLDHIRPSVLYVLGGASPIQNDLVRAELLHRTGAGVGGSGGVKVSQAEEVVIEGFGHQLPLERPKETASAIAAWIGPVVRAWEKDETQVAHKWRHQSPSERLTLPAEWITMLESLFSQRKGDAKM